MKIFIPTRGRLSSQVTWDNLPSFVRDMATLVCPLDEHEAHERAGRRAVATPNTVQGIAQTRQWIIETSPDNIVMMADDDQEFFCRKDGTYRLRKMNENDFSEMLSSITEYAREYSAVGISAVAGNNNSFPAYTISPGRMYNMYALNRRTLLDNDIRFDEMVVMEDFHVTLSLLKKGFANIILQKWCWSQKASNADGGCSIYRTSETQKQGAIRLAELHHPYVKVVQKRSKSWGNGLSERFDVRVQWKKALDDGRNAQKRKKATV